MSLTLEQLANGVTGGIKKATIKGFDVDVHLQPITMAQVATLQADLEALPEDDEATHGKASMNLMMRTTLCDATGARLSEQQAQGLINNSAPEFILALQQVMQDHVSPSVEDARGN